jgi:hypothetical protein
MYPAGTRRGELKTVRDLLASQDLDKLFGSRTPRYREQFRKIAEHEDILDSDLGDRDVHNKLLASQARAWNWMGFFLTVFWAAYWRLPTAWVVVGLIIVIDITAQLTGFEIGATLGIAVGVIFGILGNSLLLREVVRSAYKGTLTQYTPSLPLAFLPLAVILLEVAVSLMIFKPELFA